MVAGVGRAGVSPKNEAFQSQKTRGATIAPRKRFGLQIFVLVLKVRNGKDGNYMEGPCPVVSTKRSRFSIC